MSSHESITRIRVEGRSWIRGHEHEQKERAESREQRAEGRENRRAGGTRHISMTVHSVRGMLELGEARVGREQKEGILP